jgi:hypothetical protein
MRLGLGFVMAWFGVQELRSPGEWTVFVPSFVGGMSPVSLNDLVLVHGFLLLLAGAAVVLGLFYLFGALLAVGLFLEIVFGLWYDGGLSDLVIRDIGLLALAVAVSVDRSTAWHIENFLACPAEPGQAERGSLIPRRRLAGSIMASGAMMLGLVAGLAIVIYGTGNSTAAPGADELTLATSTPSPSESAKPSSSSSAGVASATPSPSGTATNTLFDTWRYKQKSYQIYPGDLSSDAKRALAGFEMNVQDQGSSVLLQLKATSSRYHDASFTVDKGNTAYFVETSTRDDPGDTAEQNLGDDGVIVVNPQGYLIRS